MMSENLTEWFAIAGKELPTADIERSVKIAIAGGIHTPKEMKLRLELKPEWLLVLQLASEEALTDKGIAKKINVCEKTVRNYWNHIYNALQIYDDADQNIRVQSINMARKRGVL